MAITRIKGIMPENAYGISRIELWSDEPIPEWPKRWRYFDMAPDGRHRMYYNAEHPIFLPFAAYNRDARTGGMRIEGDVISANGLVEVAGQDIGGLWSSRAGVFNHYTLGGKGAPDTVVDVSVHEPRYEYAMIATSIKWLALYALLCKARSPVGETLPVQAVTEYHHGVPETTYEPTRAFDWTYEVAAK